MRFEGAPLPDVAISADPHRAINYFLVWNGTVIHTVEYNVSSF